MYSIDYLHQQVVNRMFFYFVKRNWKKLKRYISLGSINKLLSLKNMSYALNEVCTCWFQGAIADEVRT